MRQMLRKREFMFLFIQLVNSKNPAKTRSSKQCKPQIFEFWSLFFSVLICYTKGKEGKLMVTPTNQPTDRLTLSDETGSRDRFWDQNGLKTSMETILRPKCDTIWRLVPRPFLRPKWSRDQYQDQNVTLCRPTDWQGEYSAICLSEGWKIEGRDLQYNREIQIPQEHWPVCLWPRIDLGSHCARPYLPITHLDLVYKFTKKCFYHITVIVFRRTHWLIKQHQLRVTKPDWASEHPNKPTRILPTTAMGLDPTGS